MHKQALTIVALVAAAMLLTSCGGKNDNKKEDATTINSTVAMPSESVSATAVNGAVVKTGAEVPASDDFNPTGTGTVFQGMISGVVTNPNDLDNHYAVSTGQVNLDLENMQAPVSRKMVNIDVQDGQVSITLPANVKVELSCSDVQGLRECKPGTYNSTAPGQALKLNVSVRSGQLMVVTP